MQTAVAAWRGSERRRRRAVAGVRHKAGILDRRHVVAGNNLFKHAPRLGRSLAAAAVGEELMPALRPEARLGHDPTP